MGLTVGIGVSGWFWEDDDTPQWEEFLKSIVATGCTNRVRDLRLTSSDELSDDTPVYEAWKGEEGEIQGRYLDDDERAPIIADLKETYETWDSWAGFSWDHLEEVGAYDIQTINLVMDVEDSRDFKVEREGDRHRIASLERSASNWGANDDQCRIAMALHVPVGNHRLILKSI